MRKLLVIAAGVAVVASSATFAQEPKLAPEGRGLLPRPPAATREAPTEKRFSVGPSGVLSRTIFETDEDPNFKLIFRDFSFPPDKQARTIDPTVCSLPPCSQRKGRDQRRKAEGGTDSAGENAAQCPPARPSKSSNSGDYPMVLRALIVEAK